MTKKIDKSVHFIGIGGIGMSALARVCLEQGYRVSGSTLSGEESLLTFLEKMGAKLYQGHDASYISKDVDYVVVSSSIQPKNVELLEAKKLNKTILHRSQFLDYLISGYKVIAVSGTHGKTTTTALIGHMLDVAGIDPLIITGGIMPLYQSNVRQGKGPWAVIEADESDGTFLNLSRVDIAIVTNVEPEHMEFYGTEENLFSFFSRFLLKASQKRILGNLGSFCDFFVKQNESSLNITYGTQGSVSCKNVSPFLEGTKFDVMLTGPCPVLWEELKLKLRGIHNVYNALAAVSVAQALEIKASDVYKAFSTFESVRRRLTYTGSAQGVHVLDDYAHHPTEVKAVLEALRCHYPKQKIFVIFQPHRYTRLQYLMEGFAESFSNADEVMVLPVYSAGEHPVEGINSKTLLEKIQKFHDKAYIFSEWSLSLPDLCDHIARFSTQEDIIVCCGAGDITKLAYALPEALERVLTGVKTTVNASLVWR
ncbi:MULTISPECIES: UDP-N-acetylmuramate--L-alanine ligase [Holospora]|uniref:UDP-N-acetylmuramate--L-alanine ligase n=2 Tax=Holospora TaxID=44747 RepID=A0A061JFU3_9PROT|nr:MULTISPECIES: UDP-N-acetylmuramate--L-alanine ligase [Holospora]ETZ04601.1 UDP-N-acetylmuramate--L-alanine ligase [Holospora undulata HU1]GAJ45872.1 UDP-N-acetylmuramate--L-alanine ligase [Holospora elegans E1]